MFSLSIRDFMTIPDVWQTATYIILFYLIMCIPLVFSVGIQSSLQYKKEDTREINKSKGDGEAF